ncbi:UvrD-helicase domain-containing protein [Pseudocnuella soli]|uniref:UvrD-helicase domain-containing protein n=1 Tax=Pseudocnuella soli TaxID=2502779 RepID=UPI0014054001|nr:UvrD-helicase domain-containing protein [Pseudocnuella soli]
MSNDLLAIIILTVLAISGVYFYRLSKEREKRQREEEEQRAKKAEEVRQKALAHFRKYLDDVNNAVNEFSAFLKPGLGYFSNFQLESWTNNYRAVYNSIDTLPYQKIGLNDKEVDVIKRFKNFFIGGKQVREDYNKQFIESELKEFKSFFDNVEGRKLDEQQRRAIITDEDNSLVIAGAGSGKTTTIVGKVNYVLKKYNVSAENVLLISFTRRSAQSLKERINIEGVEAKTFHRFGMDVITDGDDKKPSIFDEAQFRQLLIRFFNDEIESHQYLDKVTTFFIDFLKPEKAQHDFKLQGDYIQYLKDHNYATYKVNEPQSRGRTTIKREVVKSIEECKIANFLLFNGLDYDYEAPYEHVTASKAYRQYKPDFTITQNNKKYYLEHFAVARDGSVPAFFANDNETLESAKTRYWEKMEWAREMHKQHQTSLIETYSYEMFEGNLFDKLKEKLEAEGIILKPRSPHEIWQIIKSVAEDEVKGFLDLFATFITLMKSNNYSIEDLFNKNEGKSAFQKERNRKFIEIIKPIYLKYESYLKQRGEIDFSDMINKASQYIASGSYSKRFSYIIIDEFQDISIGRYQLVKALKDANPGCKLFCVGDDWQSIYRFTGSDIALFKEFEKYFGFTVKSKIETTYRFHPPLMNLSSAFILRNPNQAAKELKSANLQKSTQYKIIYSVSENQDDTLALKEVFDELVGTVAGIDEKEVYILGRYSFDINRIKNENNVFHVDQEEGMITYRCLTADGSYTVLRAKFLTVHKAKGEEADIVIVLNCNAGKYGFPSGIADDLVLNLLLSEADQFENGEERRLFYVAMTRAKESLYLVADSTYKSKFITELEVSVPDAEVRKCPKCLNSDLVRRSGSKNGKVWAFDGCSNFAYGCEYKEWVNFNLTT